MNEEQLNEEREINLVKLFNAFLERWWIIALAAVLCAGMVFAFVAVTNVPAYESESLIYISSVTDEVDRTYITSGDINAATTLVPAYTTILKSRKVYDMVEADVPEFEYTYNEYKNIVDASAYNNTQVLRIVVTCEDPTMANAIADELVDVMQVQIPAVIVGSSVTVVDQASMPVNPVSSGIAKKTIIGFLVGMIVSMGVIAVIEIFFNDTLDSEDWIKETFGEDLPVLAVIPDANSAGDKKYGYHRYGRYGNYYKSPAAGEKK